MDYAHHGHYRSLSSWMPIVMNIEIAFCYCLSGLMAFLGLSFFLYGIIKRNPASVLVSLMFLILFLFSANDTKEIEKEQSTTTQVAK